MQPNPFPDVAATRPRSNSLNARSSDSGGEPMVEASSYTSRSDFAENRSLGCSKLLAKSIIAALGIISVAPLCFANTIAVSRCNDLPPGRGVKGESLRTAVGKTMDGDIVDLSAMVTCSTITLQSGEIAATAANLAIVGPTDHNITIDGAGAGRVFYHSGSGVLSLSSLTLAHGHTVGDGGCIYTAGSANLSATAVYGCSATKGGGIRASGLVLLQNSTVTSNSASGNGGGIYSLGNTAIISSGVDFNSSGASGGGVFAVGNISAAFATVSVNSALSSSGGGLFTNGTFYAARSTISGNLAGSCGGLAFNGPYATLSASTVDSNLAISGIGGGLCAATDRTASPPRTLTLKGTTVSGNSAFLFGGGVEVHGTNSTNFGTNLVLSNSTISGNSAGTGGGGLRVDYGTVKIRNSTIAFNDAPQGGGLLITRPTNMGQPYRCNLETHSSIFANNSGASSGSDIFFDICEINTFSGFDNIILEPNGTIPQVIKADPLLLPLAFNGGPLRTHALQPSSPAIDQGSNPDNLTTDERGIGFARVQGSSADIGAYELQDKIFSNGFD